MTTTNIADSRLNRRRIYKDFSYNYSGIKNLLGYVIVIFGILVDLFVLKLFLQLKPSGYTISNFFIGLINLKKPEWLLVGVLVVFISSIIVVSFFIYKCLSDVVDKIRGLSVVQGNLENVKKWSFGKVSGMKFRINGKNLHPRTVIAGYDVVFPEHLLFIPVGTELVVVYHPVSRLIEEIYE